MLGPEEGAHEVKSPWKMLDISPTWGTQLYQKVNIDNNVHRWINYASAAFGCLQTMSLMIRTQTKPCLPGCYYPYPVVWV